MTECQVICRDCDTPSGSKVWHWLCETCAELCVENHRRQTGHTELELRITRNFTAAELAKRIADHRAENYWPRARKGMRRVK